MSGSGGNLSDSDGDKEKRHRRKVRPQCRSKEIELRSNYATIRHPMAPMRRDYYDYEDKPEGYDDEPPPRSPSNASPRGNEIYFKKRGAPRISTPKLENKSFSEYVKPGYDDYENRLQIQQKNQQHFKKSTSRDLYIDDDERKPPKRYSPNEQQQQRSQQPQPNSGKFNFEGFESDFNNTSPKQQPQQGRYKMF